MFTGKLVFAQLMGFLPLHTFRRCVARYPSSYPTKTFSHLDQYLCMAFAQLTFRESLRDIEVCLRAHKSKIYHFGIRGHVARSNLGDANEKRDWRIYRDFANALIVEARRLYAGDAFRVDLENTVYALDTTTIDLSLKVFPWAHFRKAKAAVKMHTQIDLRGNIPSFIYVSDGKMHEVNVLDLMMPEPGSFTIMDRGFLDFTRLYRLTQAAAFFVIRPKSNTLFRRVYSRPVDKTTGSVACNQATALRSNRSSHRPKITRRLSAISALRRFLRRESRQASRLLHQQFRASRVGHRSALQMSLAGRALFQMDQTAPADQGVFRHQRERSQNANLDRHQRLCAHRHRQKTSRRRSLALHNPTDIEPRAFRESAATPIA